MLNCLWESCTRLRSWWDGLVVVGYWVFGLGLFLRGTAGNHVPDGSGLVCSWLHGGGLVGVVSSTNHGPGSKFEGLSEPSRTVAAL